MFLQKNLRFLLKIEDTLQNKTLFYFEKNGVFIKINRRFILKNKAKRRLAKKTVGSKTRRVLQAISKLKPLFPLLRKGKKGFYFESASLLQNQTAFDFDLSKTFASKNRRFFDKSK